MDIPEMAKAPETNIQDTLKARRSVHGPFSDHSDISQRLKRTMNASSNWASVSNSKKEALEMIQHKIARILNGGEYHIDNWHDIAGYATLVENELRGE